MSRKPRIEERKHWIISDEVRAYFIERGEPHLIKSQFMIDKMMEAKEAIKDHPIPTWILDTNQK